MAYIEIPNTDNKGDDFYYAFRNLINKAKEECSQEDFFSFLDQSEDLLQGHISDSE